MRGRSIPNSRQSSASERLFVSAIGAKVRKMARSQIRPADHLLDAVQQDGARRVRQNLLIIGVKLPYREAAAGRQAAEGVGKPIGQAGQVVECEDIAVVGRNHQLALFARERPHRGGVGVDQSLEKFGENRFCGALLARYRQKRIGTT
jgi:hypothetical protein